MGTSQSLTHGPHVPRVQDPPRPAPTHHWYLQALCHPLRPSDASSNTSFITMTHPLPHPPTILSTSHPPLCPIAEFLRKINKVWLRREQRKLFKMKVGLSHCIATYHIKSTPSLLSFHPFVTYVPILTSPVFITLCYLSPSLVRPLTAMTGDLRPTNERATTTSEPTNPLSKGNARPQGAST